MYPFLFGSAALATFLGLFGLATVHLGASLAYDISVASVVGILLLSMLPGRAAKLFFLTLCAWVVLRYIAWRFYSLPLGDGPVSDVAAVMMLCAEVYGVSMLILGLFVNAWPLEREPVALPSDPDLWPSVDIYIPTYSEPLSVVAPTLLGAMQVDYPSNKLKVYVLDDGWGKANNPKTPGEVAIELRKRSEDLKALCERHGATWLTRERHEHAKSGNLNAAMTKTTGELILILDADHVPTTDILRNTAGFFLNDEKLAFVQTPHFFLNADPIEKNLGMSKNSPSENDMFYRIIQKGLDLWNSAFFCGSAALIRRKAIDSVDGFSIDSITEDASTSVKMHQKGWNSAYLGIPMVCGLQPETFESFTAQRRRWAVGMMQIFIKQNPLLIRGLTVGQRLSYLSTEMYWFFPFARAIFFIAPLLAVFFDLSVYPKGLDTFYIYGLPYLVAVIMSFQRSFGRVRRFLVSELYETLQTFYTIPVLISTMLNPSAPTFKVTAKGQTLDKEFISQLNKPFYIFYALTVAAIGLAAYRFSITDGEARAQYTLSLAWLSLNFILLSGALGVLVELVQRRERPRIDANEKITLVGEFGEREAVLVDVTETGALIRSLDGEKLPNFGLKLGDLVLPARILEERSRDLGRGEHAVVFDFPTPRHERAAVMLAYGKSSRWMDVWKQREIGSHFLFYGVGFIRLALKFGGHHLSKLLSSVR